MISNDQRRRARLHLVHRARDITLADVGYALLIGILVLMGLAALGLLAGTILLVGGVIQ